MWNLEAWSIWYVVHKILSGLRQHAVAAICFLLQGLTINLATLESAVYGFAHAEELKPIRKVLFPNTLPRSAHRPPKR